MGFALPENALGGAGRKVRCGGCGHSWLQLAEAAATLESPVTMEPTQDVLGDAPGCLPSDLLEVDAPIGAGALDVEPWRGEPDPLEEPAAEEWEEEEEEEEDEEAAASAPAAPAEEPSVPQADQSAEPDAAADAAEAAAEPRADGRPQAAAESDPAREEPADPAAVPAAWNAPGLAALAPLVAAIAEDKARAAGIAPSAHAAAAPREPTPAVVEPEPAPVEAAPAVEAPPPAVEAPPDAVEATPPAVEAPSDAVAATPDAVEATPPAVEAAPAPEAFAVAADSILEGAALDVALPEPEAPGPDLSAAPPLPEPTVPAPTVAEPPAEAVAAPALEAPAPEPAAKLDTAAMETAAPVEIVAPELALIAATSLTPVGASAPAPAAAETGDLPPIEIPEPPGPSAILVALRDDRPRESDSADALVPPPEPALDEDLSPEDAVPPELAAAALKRHRRLRFAAVTGALALIVAGLAANEATQGDGVAMLATIRTGGAPPEEGLGFANVSTQRTAVGGVPMLVVTGEVVNDTNRPRPVPPLRGALLGGADELQSWTFTAGPRRLDPGQRASFETVVRNPARGATDVRLTFANAGS
jgi:predicted Zn finger-like uncharacterized protein